MLLDRRHALSEDLIEYEFPFLLATQVESYRWFLFEGFKQVFEEVFPIRSKDGALELHFLDYKVILPEHADTECLEMDLDYSASIKGIFEFRNLKRKGEIIRQEVYICDIPFMTSRGTFIINGVERVIVSQLVRSPGVYFTPGQKRTASEDAPMVKLIPYRGSWLKYQYDKRRKVYQVRLDTTRRVVRIPITQFLRALGFTVDLEKKVIYHPDPVYLYTDREGNVHQEPLTKEEWDNQPFPIQQPLMPTVEEDRTRDRREALIEIWKRLNPTDSFTEAQLEEMLRRRYMDPVRYDLAEVGRYMVNRKLGINLRPDRRVLSVADFMETFRKLYELQEEGKGQLDDTEHLNLENRRVEPVGELLQEQMRKGMMRVERIITERMMQPTAEEESPKSLINTRPLTGVIKEFFGSSQMSQFMDETNPLTSLTHKRRLSALGPKGLTRDAARFDFRDVHRSHYGRICPIETPEGQNIGLITSLAGYARLNKYGFVETPYHPVKKGRVISSEVKYLPAFEDTKFRIAPATVKRDKRGRILEERLHVRHGDNIELVSREEVDLIEISPAQFVSVTTSLIPFLEHDDSNRALMGSNMQRQAVPLIEPEAPLVGTGNERRVAEDSGAVLRSHFCGQVIYADSEKITLAKGIVWDRQTGEILDLPNLETLTNLTAVRFVRKRDATEAMKRLARLREKLYPSLVFERNPLDEHEIVVRAKSREIVEEIVGQLKERYQDVTDKVPELVLTESKFDYIFTPPGRELDRKRVVPPEDRVFKPLPEEMEQYETIELRKFKRSNQGSLVNQRPVVKEGDVVIKGDLLADGSTTSGGELALGKNVLVAFLPWRGYNFEDAVLVSEELVTDDIFTSIHIEKLECEARETKVGPEKITREMRQYSSKIERTLDERGIIREGAWVKAGDVLVGKITPRGETDLSGEEKLIRMVFGEKGRNYKNTPLKLPHGEEGVVIHTQFFSREKGDDLPHNVVELARVFVARTLKLQVGDKIAGRHGNKGVISMVLPVEDMPFLPDGTPIQMVLNPLGVPSRMNIGQVLEAHLGLACSMIDESQLEEVRRILAKEEPIHFDRSKRKHELQGVEEIRLRRAKNPLKVKSPPFQSVKEDQIRQLFAYLNLPLDGKTILYDGVTGEPFKERVMVGVMYIMKLHHLVEEKIHARSTGGYALITQQPLGGKAQFGGQRLGEMEVWALEGYGAAYLLKEMLTIKSDDVEGRSRTYQAIVDGRLIPEPGLPEGFNVIVNELKSLALNVEVKYYEEEIEERERRMRETVFASSAVGGDGGEVPELPPPTVPSDGEFDEEVE